LAQEIIASKFITFGAEFGMNVSQGVRTSVIVQFKEQTTPFMIGVHFTNLTNLVVQTLSKMGIMGKIENLLQSLYCWVKAW
jgi:hypothetical protein